MSADERARRAENRELAQLEAAIAELQQNVSGQIDALSDTILDHSCTLDQLADNMADGNSHSRGANVPISPFYGNRDEDFTQYIKQFELVCHANNYDDDKRAQILASYLRDKAFYVYDSLTPEEKSDYDALKTALTAKFQTSDYRRYAHQKFQSRKQLATESVPDYGCAVHKLGMAALSTVDTDQRDALIREKFISGLLPHLHELIVYSNPKNFHEAMTLAERLEGLQANRPDHSARHVMLLESIHDRISNLESNNQKRYDDKPNPEIAYVIERPVQRQEFSQQPSYPRANLNNFRQDFCPTGTVCFRCNRTGHIARNCPQNQNMNSIICRNCNTTGHYARNCQRRGISNRGRGMAPRTNIWTNDRNAARRPYATNPQTFNRSMAIGVPETQHSDIDEVQNWRPLVGCVKTTQTRDIHSHTTKMPSDTDDVLTQTVTPMEPLIHVSRTVPTSTIFVALLFLAYALLIPPTNVCCSRNCFSLKKEEYVETITQQQVKHVLAEYKRQLVPNVAHETAKNIHQVRTKEANQPEEVFEPNSTSISFTSPEFQKNKLSCNQIFAALKMLSTNHAPSNLVTDPTPTGRDAETHASANWDIAQPESGISNTERRTARLDGPVNSECQNSYRQNKSHRLNLDILAVTSCTRHRNVRTARRFCYSFIVVKYFETAPLPTFTKCHDNNESYSAQHTQIQLDMLPRSSRSLY